MNFNGKVGPIGNLDKADILLAETESALNYNTMPVIQCKKDRCSCGLCAPKAQDLSTYNKIIKKYQQ